MKNTVVPVIRQVSARRCVGHACPFRGGGQGSGGHEGRSCRGPEELAPCRVTGPPGGALGPVHQPGVGRARERRA